jgi:hypothetical protein
VKKQKWHETFVPENEDAKHFPGSLWDPFFEGGSDELMTTLRDHLENSRKVHAYSDLLPAPEKVPDEWPSAFYQAWPDQQGGIQFVISRQGDVNKVEALFPFAMKGVPHSIVIDKVVVFKTGVEAQIECSVQDAAITFYDILYANNRVWLLKTTVIRGLKTDADLDVNILVAQRVWGDKPLPKICEDIEGVLWLQGYLWRPGPEEKE